MNEDAYIVCVFEKKKVLYIYEREKKEKKRKKCDHIAFLTQCIKRHESRKEKNSKNVI